MSMVSNFVLIFLSIFCIFSLTDQRSVDDHTCAAYGPSSLCLKAELQTIAKMAGNIAHQSIAIEKIIQQTQILKTLDINVEAEMNYTRIYLPISYYHKKFFFRPNIDKEFLNELLLEAHNAMAFFSNSIDDLLHSKEIFAEKSDAYFRKIRDYLRHDMICRYRSVLDVFGSKWKFIYQIGRIRFSRKSDLSPSFIHNVHSMVIARGLKQWMKQISQMVENLEMKFLTKRIANSRI